MSLLDEVRQVFIDRDIATTRDPQHPAFSFVYQGEHERWLNIVHVHEDTRNVVVYAMLPFRASEDHAAAVALTVAHVKFGMIVGNFEFDPEDGELRYKTTLALGRQPFEPALFDQIVAYNASTVQRFWHTIREAAGG